MDEGVAGFEPGEPGYGRAGAGGAVDEVVLWAVQKGDDGWRAEVGLIRPAGAFDGAEVGDGVEFHLEEMGLEGEFQVVSVAPAPKREVVAGKSRVTGVFRYSRATVYNLWVAGESAPLGVTANHPFWSADRGGWVPQCELEIGERVRVSGGTAMVVVREERGDEPVCNIEVEGDHCYRVGEQGILVHNASAKWDAKQVIDSSSPGYDYVKQAAAYRGGSNDLALRVGKRNLGRVKYKTKDGTEKWYRPKTFVIGRAGFGKHAKAQIQLFLESQTDDGYACGLIVLELFTERYPCDSCATQFLNKLAHDNSEMSFPVYWFAPHGENFDDDPGGKQLRDEYMRIQLYPWPT